jgi:hypothetical protein
MFITAWDEILCSLSIDINDLFSQHVLLIFSCYYFPLIWHGSHKEWRRQQFFVAAGTFLLMCYPTIIEVHTDPQSQASNNSSILARIRRRGNVFTEPLTSNERKNTLSSHCIATIGAIHIQTHRPVLVWKLLKTRLWTPRVIRNYSFKYRRMT